MGGPLILPKALRRATRRATHRAVWTPASILLFLCGCYEEPVPLPEDDGGRVDAAAVQPLTLRVQPRLVDEISPEVSMRYVAESLDVGQRLSGEIPPGAWPRTVVLQPAAQGTWQVVVFVDRDADGLFDDCPFPPRVGDTERAVSLDRQSGRAVARGGTVDVLVETRTCGPGDVATGVAGEAVADEAVPGPVLALVAPLDSALPSLRITLESDGLQGTRPFSLGELLPGRWRLTVFADADGDATPSPCDATPGGGDRFVADPVDIDVVAGERVALPTPLALRRLDCPEALTGLTGEVSLAAGLVPDPTQGGPLGPLAGAVRLALFPSAGGAPVAELTLLPSIDARPLPHRFTATHLPEGAWRLVVWVDRDDDGAFTPCGGLEGIDAVWLQVEGVRVAAGQLEALPPLALVQNPCDARAETGLTGRVTVEAEEGPVGSGRPLRLELRPQGGGEVLRVPLLDNHRTGGRFIVSGLPAGRHDLIFHLDTDRDGVFVDCRQAPYADRAALAMDDVEIPVGQIVAIEAPVLPLLGCGVPRAELRPRVLFDPAVVAGEATLRLRIVEQGGYQEDRVLLARHAPGRDEPLIDPIRLAPGEFELTAWLDTVPDGVLGTCGTADEDAAVARLALRLDAADPQAEPLLVLEPPCP